MLRFQVAGQHPQLGELVRHRIPSVDSSPLPRLLLIPSAQVPSLSTTWVSPRLQLAACCPRVGTFSSKGPLAGINPKDGGWVHLSHAALHAAIHLFLFPKVLPGSKKMKHGDTFATKILWRKPELNKEQTRLGL